MTRQRNNYLWVYATVAVLLLLGALHFIVFNDSPGYVTVKYRNDKVDLSSSNFESLSSSDSTVRGAWYDKDNEYMVIKLSDTYYHYCGLPTDAWSGLKSSSSPYDYYQEDIRGDFDCRVNPVPSYE